MRRILIWAGAVTLAIVVAAGLYLAIYPGLALTRIEEQVAAATGRGLTAAGGAHLEIAPQLALRLDGVALANPAGVDGNILQARSLRFTLTFADLFRPGGGSGTVTLAEPVFSFLLDEQGRPNWQMPETLPPLRLALENAQIAFLDVRTGQSYKFGGLNAAVDLSATGELDLEGTAILNGAFSRVRAHVKSPNRIAGDGSPVDLGLETPVLKASFSGRMAAASNFGLAGPVSLSGDDLRAALAWAGISIGGRENFKAFTVAGGLDWEGQALTVNTADLTLDGLSAKGRVGLDLAQSPPVLLADMETGEIDVARFFGTPVAEGWDPRPLGLDRLKGANAQFTIKATDLVVRGHATGPAKLTGRLSDGVLTLGVEAEGLTSEITFDADGVAADFVSTRPFFTWLEGSTTLTMKVSGKGKSEADIVSTLRGEAEISGSQGILRGFDIPALATAVGTAVHEGWPRQGATPFDLVQAKFTLADGIATATVMELTSPALKLTGKGDVDLLRQALDLTFEPRLVAGDTVTPILPVAVAVRGPWGAPKIFPDVPDILIDPDAAYQALRVMDMPKAESN